jgi:serine/threonine protein kinase
MHVLCLIDFGLSRQFVDSQTGEQLPPRELQRFVGTWPYASLNAHTGTELSRRDDIISWLYTVVEMTEGKLPWPGKKDRQATYRLKKKARPAKLFRSLPSQFVEIFESALALGFYDRPDYARFYALLDAAIREADSGRSRFDWERMDPAAVPILRALPRRADHLGSPEGAPAGTRRRLPNEDDPACRACSVA